MTMSTNAAGVACCGNCGSEIEVRCTGGCADPDVVPRKDYIASLPKPCGPKTKAKKIIQPWHQQPGCCTWRSCTEPIAPRPPGMGRPPRRCAYHLESTRKYRNKRLAKQKVPA